MSEMLANYHFIIRNYCNAIPELEVELSKNPSNYIYKKKLIICYTQTDKLSKAIDLFIELLDEDINLIINTDVEYEDCPCPDLIAMLENGTIQREGEFNLLIELGILWLYCDRNESVKYFLRAQALDPSDKSISKILNLLQKVNRSKNGKETE